MIVAIEIWTPTECYQHGGELPKGSDAMKDTETDLIYCLDCGSDLEEADYEQATRYTNQWG